MKSMGCSNAMCLSPELLEFPWILYGALAWQGARKIANLKLGLLYMGGNKAICNINL